MGDEFGKLRIRDFPLEQVAQFATGRTYDGLGHVYLAIQRIGASLKRSMRGGGHFFPVSEIFFPANGCYDIKC